MGRIYPLPEVIIPVTKNIEILSTIATVSIPAGESEATASVNFKTSEEKAIQLVSVRAYAIEGDTDKLYDISFEDSSGVYYMYTDINKILVDADINIVVPADITTVKIKTKENVASDTKYTIVIGYKTVTR